MFYEYSVFGIENRLDHLAPNGVESVTDRYIQIRPESSAKVRTAKRAVLQYKTVLETQDDMDKFTILVFNYHPTKDPLASFLRKHDLTVEVDKTVIELEKERKIYKIDDVKAFYTECTINGIATVNLTLTSRSPQSVDAMRRQLDLRMPHQGFEAHLYGALNK